MPNIKNYNQFKNIDEFYICLAEYGLEGLVSTKCDTYSFGIMMMEVFTRTKPNSEMFGENLSLKSWVTN